MSLTLAEKLMHTTVRLECKLQNGASSTGTGFFFTYELNNEKNIPVIITNKHVIENSIEGSFVLTKMDDNKEPIMGSTERIKVPTFEEHWIKHPDPNVDIAIFTTGPLFNDLEKEGIQIYAPPLSEKLIPDEDEVNNFTGIDDITMIGYPNGIWDQQNNMPIIRRGVTATNPKYDYNGLPIFVIDCACFPGSSGSPVLIFDQGGYMEGNGSYSVGGTRVYLIGILYAGPQHTAQGEIQTINVPLVQKHISLSNIPNNLGFVVKSTKILDFKEILKI